MSEYLMMYETHTQTHLCMCTQCE